MNNAHLGNNEALGKEDNYRTRAQTLGLGTRKPMVVDNAKEAQHHFIDAAKGREHVIIVEERCRHSYNRRQIQKLTESTNVWQRVLWGSKQRVQGSNGWNAAQLSCPRGTTLTFQLNAGVSCGTGRRHGATTHPRGRHLRGVMTLLPRGMTQVTAREQQPPQQQPQPLGIMAHYRN